MKSFFSQLILIVMLVAAALLPESSGFASPSLLTAEATSNGNAVNISMGAGTRVNVAYSNQPPVLSAEEQSSIQNLQSRSNLTGDYAGSVVPAPGAKLGPEMAHSNVGASSSQGASGTNSSFAANAFAVFRNTAVNSSLTGYPASMAMEPSTGVGGMRIFQTVNWYAARSLDGGSTWSYLNPYTIFNDTTVTSFCCDQVTLYDPSRDVEFWLLLYSNGLKLAVSSNSFTNWCYYNITPATIGEPSTTTLDYNDLAIGTRYVYIATNYTPSGGVSGAFILRAPIDTLATCGAWSGSYIKRNDSFTFKPVQGASDIMYWASDWTNLTRGSSMRIFAWPENGSSYSMYDETGLPAWAFQYNNGAQNCGSLSGSTVKNWCQTASEGVLGGALLRGVPTELDWSFDADQDVNHPFPYTRIFRFRAIDMAYLGQAEIWTSWAAWQYASLSPNARGDMAINVAWGGQAVGGTAYYPSASVLIQDDYSPSQPWQQYNYVIGAGNPCTYNGKYRWGDFLTVRPYYPAGFVWIAAGFALEGGSCGTADWHMQWNNLAFGRGRDQNSYYRWYNK